MPLTTKQFYAEINVRLHRTKNINALAVGDQEHTQAHFSYQESTMEPFPLIYIYIERYINNQYLGYIVYV